MRRFALIFSVLSALIPLGTHAYSVSCSSVPGSGGCGQCFHFDLAASNKPTDIFVPRTNLTTGQQEVITEGSITAQALQGATVTPTGTITNLFDTIMSGTGQNSWVWAKMKSGNAVVRKGIPSTVDYSKPVYVIKYATKSSIRENNAILGGTEVNHLECGFFYAPTPAIVCGNGSKEGNEQCDDGNRNNNDACTNSCLLPVCGNGSREGNEQCDDGNRSNNDSCTNACRTPLSIEVCGNGIIDGNEQCDDGNLNDTDSCTNACRDYIVDPRCHVQVLQNTGSVPTTTSITCSGQPIGRPIIAITKNNTLQTSFQSTSAQYTFSQAGRYTVHCYPDAQDQTNVCRTSVDISGTCGNGTREGSEQCDDGINNGGGGCTSACMIPDDPGAICGNGILEGGEQCDMGGYNGQGSCTLICQNHTPRTGPNSTFVFIMVALAALFGGFYSWKYIQRKQSSSI